ncbi:snoRNA-binding rRNA-processing protein UTP10 [Aspergillus clavatus NRRL 1]|uniref:U3 small nucleolar RNA-associated protein 10 n=1 Tax=Aspergillus clavatus (strain ATCC 1007 / CBS 513.65 / DSM 816 / NCTC 3887 / NRRL 1 / QM 1276 / 107) TaxID=344612 RepID=UTP10_ASPCL|nr:SSU processome component Utp10, putative [Aspergillus clavatus NRRL 1]A1CUH7.1 RecName: Full=U3 small nucleolar RNA-associated protein 10 [Aspergillus clavatus NRRL 1]EAW06964.1 SSU processome component Utp10, putative [Aspergillus clavatus NRRL 1]
MASSLAAQLSQIAAKSTNQLDLKAQRLSHSQSLIFDRKVAGTQDFDTVYQICFEGFQELCQLDARFNSFERTIFSEQSKTEDRTQLSAAQNKELDVVLEAFLALVGGRLLLSPAVKAVDWLIRRFRVHEYNTEFTILTFLPYYTTPLFLNLLSILPEDLTPTFKILIPYKKGLLNPPRHPLVHSATTNRAFLAAVNNYVLTVSRQQAHHHALLAFWAGIITEAVAGMLDSSRSGRREVEKQKHEDIILRILPILNDGFALKNVSELVIGCYMVSVVLAQKSSLQDKLLDGLMEAVAGSWTEETLESGLVCLAVLAQQKPETRLPRRALKAILRLDDIVKRLTDISSQYQTSNLLLGVVAGCVDDLTKHKDTARLELLPRVFQTQLLGELETSKAMAMVLHAASNAHRDGTMSLDTQACLADLVQEFNQSEFLQPIFQKTIAESTFDTAAIEHNLQTVIVTAPAPRAVEDVVMGDAEKVVEQDGFSSTLEALVGEKLFKSSFLSAQSIPVFDRLVQAFALAASSEEKTQVFSDLAVLGKSEVSKSPQYLSFFIRVFSGPYPIGTRAMALNIVATFLTSTSNLDLDFQAILPFLLVALADPSERIRREAAAALAAIGGIYKKHKKGENVWGRDTIYGQEKQSKSVQWLPTRDAQKVFERAVLPSLEECIFDPGHISKVLETTLRGASVDPNASELKKPLRLSFFTFLCSHAIQLPLFTPKLGLLGLLNRIDKAGGTTRTKELEPLLKAWRGLSEQEVSDICEKQRVPVSEVESQMVTIVTPKEKDALTLLLSNVSPYSESLRSTFVAAIFARVKDIWARVSEDRQVLAAEQLFDIALGLSDSALVNNCRNLLRSVELPGSVLIEFLEKIPVSLTDMEAVGPAPKRRRTSQSNMIAMTVKDEAEFGKVMEKMTFILELVDSSSPETHPELADGLFQTLAALHHFKSQIQSGMSYLLSLTLGSLLAIVNRSKESAKAQFDTSVIRADLVVDCVRTTESPQVQNAALLLVSGLSVIAPELVLHSVMPIFTFMGSSVLRKDDEYSVSVIDQTIDQVVPALIQSLRNQKRDVVSGTSELLLSFTAAFEHIPSHRRLRLFHALITKLGTQDFLFAVLAMLANRYAMDKDVLVLMTGLVSDASAPVELTVRRVHFYCGDSFLTKLQTYYKYLDLVTDSLKAKPSISQVLLGIGSDDGREPQKVAVDLLRDLAYLFKHSSLKVKMAKAFASEDEEVIGQIRALFSRILEQVLTIGDSVQSMKLVGQANSDVLGALFGTLTLVDFLDTIEVLLQRPSDELRRKVLRLLEGRLRQNPERDGASQIRVLDFLPTLVDIVRSSPDILLKHAAVACIDRIAEKYGKKDPSRVVSAAQVVASEACIGQEDDRIRIMGVLCLASMADVLGQAMIPALPEALSRSLALLEVSLEKGKENSRLHDATFSLFSALFVHIPYMISGPILDQILLLSFKSANAEDCEDDGRQEALRMMARKVDMAATLGAVDRNWQYAVQAGPAAAKETLEVVSLAIEKHPKSATGKNIGVLTSILFKVFDLRREQLALGSKATFEMADIEEIEESVNDVTIKMIYKLNDSTFRPIFTKLQDWAIAGLPKKDTQGSLARLTTFYKFLQVFFGTLQSIVTGYASYIIESVVSILGKASPSDKNTKSLWLATMRLLRSAFEHDQDEFWQSPSHLTQISKPLISQLAHATNSSTAALVIAEAVPTITELAIAADSTDNHKDLNTLLMRFLRPSSGPTGNRVAGGENPHTRLAALKAEQSLTEQLGEEWLALLPEMLPYISELMEDEDENVEREVRKWVKQIENVLGEKLDDMLT